MSTTAAIENKEQLRERWIVDTKYHADGYYEIWIGRTPEDKKPLIAVTKDEALYQRALGYEGDGCQVDCVIVKGRPQGTKAEARLESVRLSDVNS